MHIIPEYVKIDSKAYKVTAKDLLAGARHYEGMSPEDILRWLDFMMMFETLTLQPCFLENFEEMHKFKA